MTSQNPPSEPAPAGAPVFVVRGLTKGYGGRRVLDGLDFDLLGGECLVVMGRSGCGKSVTLRQLNGLERSDAGSIVFRGLELTRLSERELFPVRRRVGMLFQSGALFDSMDVFDNVAFPLREHTGLDEGQIREKVASILGMVRLRGVERHMPADLSGGMKKRVALARSLALDPEVMLFDEPTTGLDPMTSAAIANLMLRIQRDLEVSSLVVTHDVPLARRVGNRVAFLDGGRFRFLGTWEEAGRSPDPLLSSFLAGREQEDENAA